jgi:hypothetical protein
MSTIEAFRLAKKEHERMQNIVVTSGGKGNSRHVHYTKLVDGIYHTVAFTFNSKRGSSHSYEASERLAEYIGHACEAMINQILDKALELSLFDTKAFAKVAQEEANEVLRELEN